MGAYDVKQGVLIVGRKPFIKLPHEAWLVDKGKAADGMNVGEVVLYNTP